MNPLVYTAMSIQSASAGTGSGSVDGYWQPPRGRDRTRAEGGGTPRPYLYLTPYTFFIYRPSLLVYKESPRPGGFALTRLEA